MCVCACVCKCMFVQSNPSKYTNAAIPHLPKCTGGHIWSCDTKKQMNCYELAIASVYPECVYTYAYPACVMNSFWRPKTQPGDKWDIGEESKNNNFFSKSMGYKSAHASNPSHSNTFAFILIQYIHAHTHTCTSTHKQTHTHTHTQISTYKPRGVPSCLVLINLPSLRWVNHLLVP